jgi:hypothetical protein
LKPMLPRCVNLNGADRLEVRRVTKGYKER